MRRIRGRLGLTVRKFSKPCKHRWQINRGVAATATNAPGLPDANRENANRARIEPCDSANKSCNRGRSFSGYSRSNSTASFASRAQSTSSDKPDAMGRV
jgi:hypothetical protein